MVRCWALDPKLVGLCLNGSLVTRMVLLTWVEKHAVYAVERAGADSVVVPSREGSLERQESIFLAWFHKLCWLHLDLAALLMGPAVANSGFV